MNIFKKVLIRIVASLALWSASFVSAGEYEVGAGIYDITGAYHLGISLVFTWNDSFI